MNTADILSKAYAERIFGIPYTAGKANFSGQLINGRTTVEYASFDMEPRIFDDYTDWIEATTESGSEGVWIRVTMCHWDEDRKEYTYTRVGTIKTLDEGPDAWHDMGSLAGDITYWSGRVAWELYKAEQQRDKANE